MSFYLEDDKFRTVMELCYHHYDIEAYDKATEYAKKAIRMVPEHWEGYAWLANTLLEKYYELISNLDTPRELFKEAYNAARLAAKYCPEEPFVWCVLGDCAYAMWQFDESRKAHLKALSLDYTCAHCWTRIAFCIVKEKGFLPTPNKKAEIQNYFNQSIKVYHKGSRNFWNNWGCIWECCKNIEKAEEYYYRELKENPNNAMAINNIGEIFLARGDKEEADKWFRKALQINPTIKRFHWNLTRKPNSPLVSEYKEQECSTRISSEVLK